MSQNESANSSRPDPAVDPDPAAEKSTLPGAGRTLGGTNDAFADDDGRADEAVREALAKSVASGSQVDYLDAIAQLCLARLLVPLMASGDDTMTPDPERAGEMSAVMLRHPDGRQAMLAFTGIDSLSSWNASARPIPATLDVVASTAAAANAGTVLIDFEGPSPLVIDGEVLQHLALSRRLTRLEDGNFGWMATGATPSGGGATQDSGPAGADVPSGS